MLQPITDKKEIAKALDRLEGVLIAHGERVTIEVGWQQGSYKSYAIWLPADHFWAVLKRAGDVTSNRHWCLYGTANAKEHYSHSITCEINSPLEGINRRCAGVFAHDETGHLFVLHSGKIGGGRKGIGKTAMLSLGRGFERVPVSWPDGQTTEMIVVGDVDSPHFTRQLAYFVHEVERVKAVITGGEVPEDGPSDSTGFSPEFSGKKRGYKPKSVIESTCDHGLVVGALAKELESRGIKFANDQYRDLFITKSGPPTVLFEVKTGTDTSSVYGAVGQLMLHGAIQGKPPERIMVIPGTPDTKTTKALSKIGIRVLTYEWKKGEPVFEELDGLLK